MYFCIRSRQVFFYHFVAGNWVQKIEKKKIKTRKIINNNKKKCHQKDDKERGERAVNIIIYSFRQAADLGNLSDLNHKYLKCCKEMKKQKKIVFLFN